MASAFDLDDARRSQFCRGRVCPDLYVLGSSGEFTVIEAKIHSAQAYDRTQLLEYAASLPGLGAPTAGNCVEGSSKPIRFSVFDDSLAPAITEGQLVMVDPKLLPRPGDCISIVLRTSQETLFRRYRPITGGSPFKPPFELISDNPFFPARKVFARQDPVFVGTMCERTILGSR